MSHSFGYGLMDATTMVRLARKWKTVPPQHICNVTAQVFEKYVFYFCLINYLLKIVYCLNYITDQYLHVAQSLYNF